MLKDELAEIDIERRYRKELHAEAAMQRVIQEGVPAQPAAPSGWGRAFRVPRELSGRLAALVATLASIGKVP